MLASSPPRGLLEIALKLPRWLYRLHVGWLLGHRFLQLTHRGRRSGRLYSTVLEVVHYDPKTGESVVVSGWGDRSDWYQNLQQSPALAIETGGKRYVPVQRFLTPGEIYQVMRGYQRRNPWAAGIVRRLFGLRFDGSDTALSRIQTLRGVVFRPASAPSDPSKWTA
ncbi:MAG: nitroreductase family deazaflavin-dependent oxidoreductase [Thermomicrobiales bacterium]